jgi:hypothetical protein
MINRQAKFSPEDLKKFAHFDVSINHWSNEYSSLMIQANTHLEAIKALQQGKRQLLDQACKEAGIDLGTVQNIKINAAPDGSGIIDLICTPDVPDASMVASNGMSEERIPDGNSVVNGST